MLVHVLQAKSFLLKHFRRAAHRVIESPIALDGQSLQLEAERSQVPFLSSLLCTQLYLISISASSHGLFFKHSMNYFPFVYCYFVYVLRFQLRSPINSFWFSGVSREIKRKRKITLSYVICKGKDLDKRCPEIRTAPTRRTIIAMKETS